MAIKKSEEIISEASPHTIKIVGNTEIKRGIVFMAHLCV